jgi:hypothetical protein
MQLAPAIAPYGKGGLPIRHRLDNPPHNFKNNYKQKHNYKQTEIHMHVDLLSSSRM